MHSRLTHFSACFAITMAVIASFMAIRFDITAHLYGKATTFYYREVTSSGTIERLSENPRSSQAADSAPERITDIEPAAGQAYLDATTVFPLPDGSMHYVFAKQLIEHITYAQGLVMLKESLRVLKSGGRIRIATANLQRLIDLFGPSQTNQMKAYIHLKLQAHSWPATPDSESYILNQELREFGHQFVYSPKCCWLISKRPDFKTSRPNHQARARIRTWQVLTGERKAKFRSLNDYDTMVFEAVRP
jgi:methyltransferase family protein